LVLKRTSCKRTAGQSERGVGDGRRGVTRHGTARHGTERNGTDSINRRGQELAFKPENGVEFNALLDLAPMLLLQPVIQYYANVGGGSEGAVVFGLRTKVEF